MTAIIVGNLHRWHRTNKKGLVMTERVHYKFWRDSEKEILLKQLSEARTFKELASVAVTVLNHLPPDLKVHMVSGPISTGGVGTIEGNRKIFEGVIEILVENCRIDVFSQMPFEDKMVELYKEWHAEHLKEKYCLPILHNFYEPIFSSGRIIALNFIPDWESSFGAQWEYENCDRWRIQRVMLSQKILDMVLFRLQPVDEPVVK